MKKLFISALLTCIIPSAFAQLSGNDVIIQPGTGTYPKNIIANLASFGVDSFFVAPIGDTVMPSWLKYRKRGALRILPTDNNLYLYSGTAWKKIGGGTVPTNVSAFANDAGYITSVPAQTWVSITGKPTAFTPAAHTHEISDVAGLTTVLAGKEPIITAATTSQYWRGDKTWQNFPTIPTRTSDLTNNSGFITSVPAQSFSSLTGKPTTLSGYGITDAAAASHAHTFASLTSKPTTLAGYGITDATNNSRSAISLTTNGMGGTPTYDGSTGVLNVPATPIFGIASGYLLRAGGAATVGTSVIYDNGASIGIGTTSPGSPLEVVGNIASSVTGSGSTSDKTTARFTAYNPLNGYPGAQFLVGSNGNTVNNCQMQLASSNSTPSLQIPAYIAVSTNQALNSGQKSLTFGQDNNTAVIITSLQGGQIAGGTPLAIMPAGIESARFLTNGNVGVGTSAPVFRLQAAADVAYSGGFYNGESQFAVSAASDINKSMHIGYDGSSGSGFGFIVAAHGGVAWTNLALQPTAGNVGIGTTAPTAKLQVVGLSEYADNAAAIGAGLTSGAFYRTGDLLKVVH